MLVITRKPSESFTVGDSVKVNILEINGDKVKIGIEAPKNIIIMRSEVFETIRNNAESVATGKLPDLSILRLRMIPQKNED